MFASMFVYSVLGAFFGLLLWRAVRVEPCREATNTLAKVKNLNVLWAHFPLTIFLWVRMRSSTAVKRRQRSTSNEPPSSLRAHALLHLKPMVCGISRLHGCSLHPCIMYPCSVLFVWCPSRAFINFWTLSLWRQAWLHAQCTLNLCWRKWAHYKISQVKLSEIVRFSNTGVWLFIQSLGFSKCATATPFLWFMAFLTILICLKLDLIETKSQMYKSQMYGHNAGQPRCHRYLVIYP